MKFFLRLFLILLYCAAVVIPGYTYFFTNPAIITILFHASADSSTRLFTIFRLFGLYAFFLVWSQVMLGSFRSCLMRIYGPGVLKLHMTLGVFTLLFATLHPLIFYSAYLLSNLHISLIDGLSHYVGQPQVLYADLGPVAWTIMVITVSTAILRKQPLIQKHWRIIHYGNYFVFIFAFIHSFTIGTDTKTQPLLALYYFFALTFFMGVLYRFFSMRIWQKFKHKQPLS